MKTFVKASVLQKAKSDIFYVKEGVYDDGAIEK